MTVLHDAKREYNQGTGCRKTANQYLCGRFTKAQTEKTMSKLVISPSLSIDTGNTIAIQADNGWYLSRITRGDENPIEAEKDSIDAYSQFKVTILANGQIALQADSGLYLSRIARSDLNPIEAAKGSIDAYSQFKVTILANGQIALQANSGLYLSRIARGDENPIEAAKGSIDAYSQFTVVKL